MIISIIILNYKTKELTLSLLDSLFENYGKEIKEDTIEIILVDNASNDNSTVAFKKSKHFSKIKLVENKENFTQDYRHLNNLLVELYKHKGNDNIGDIKINLESLYKNILILQPDDSQSSLMLGRLSFQREEFESAEYYYKQFFQRYSTEFRKSNKQKQKKILEDIARHYGPSGDLVAMAFSGYKRNSGTLNNYFIQIDEKVENSHLLKLVLKIRTARRENKSLFLESERISWFGYDPLKIDTRHKLFGMIKMEVEHLAQANISKK